MKPIANLIYFTLLFVGAYAFAETFSNEVLTLDVPAGFEGPTSGSPGPGAKVVAYSKPERIQLGGLPASRVMWAGNFNGTPVSGVMYCVVIGTTVVTLHTQSER